MIINDYRKDRSEKEIKEIDLIFFEDIPKKVEGRKQGFGETWNLEKEQKLQDWLDKISNQYNFDFRMRYASTESLFPIDYQEVVIYG